jgi:hypothetical protein
LKLQWQNLSDPRFLLTLAALIGGTYIGLSQGADAYIRSRNLDQKASVQELERLTGIIAGHAPWVLATAGIGIVATWLLVPSPGESDSQVLARLAREKLGQPMLTDDESKLWLSVLEATKDGHQL